MDRLYRPASIRKEPLITICWLIALSGVIGGLFILSPFLTISGPTGATALFHAAAGPVGLALLAIAVFTSSTMMIYGILKNKLNWIAHGLFINLAIRIYALLIGLLVYGVQSTLIANVTMLLIVLVCYLATRLEE